MNVENLIRAQARREAPGCGFHNERREDVRALAPSVASATLAIVPMKVESIMAQSARSTTNSR